MDVKNNPKMVDIPWMGQRNPNHQLIDGQHPIIYRVEKPSFWWCSISQSSTVCSTIVIQSHVLVEGCGFPLPLVGFKSQPSVVTLMGQ